MSSIDGICRRVFGLLLHLYPAKFQVEYGEELQSGFALLLEEARSISRWEFLAVCLREARDLPVNLLRTHFEEKWMNRILHSRSVQFGWKGALAFGLSFVVANVLDGRLNSALSEFTFFHFQGLLMVDPPARTWAPIFNMAENLLSWTAASLVGGFLFAALFTGRSRFRRIAGLGILGFLVPGLIYRALMFSAYSGHPWLSWAMEALSGLCLGAVISLLADARPRKIALICAGAILYPCLVESSFRLIGALFPSASPLLATPAESVRQVALAFAIAGSFFGLLQGLVLGWGRETRAAVGPDDRSERE